MSSLDEARRLRVALWGLGRLGRAVGRAVCRDAGLQVVGARVHDAPDVGRDVGELLGGEPLGFHATDDDDDLLALDADCVVLCPPEGAEPEALDELVRRLLASGKDVVSAAGHQLARGSSNGSGEAFRTACEAGESTFHVTGLFPQLMVDRLALTLSRALHRTRDIHVVQAIDLARAPGERTFESLVTTVRDSPLGPYGLTIEEHPYASGGDAPHEAGGPFGAFTAPFG